MRTIGSKVRKGPGEWVSSLVRNVEPELQVDNNRMCSGFSAGPDRPLSFRLAIILSNFLG